MPEDSREVDAEIIHAAYADRVTDAFRIFAENISQGQNENNCKERFLRAMQLIRKARNLALDVLSAESAGGADKPAEAAKREAPPGSGMEGLSAEDQAMIRRWAVPAGRPVGG